MPENEVFTHFTKDELQVIASVILKDWRFYVVVFGAVAAGVLFLNWQAGKIIRTKVDELKQSETNQIVKAYSTITNQVATEFQLFEQDASNQIATAYSAVTNQITDQFQEPRVRQTVEAVAKGEAKTILENEIQPVVEEFHTNVEAKLKTIENGEDFLELATKARAHDYKAYLRLRSLSAQTDEAGKLSGQVVAEIDRAIEFERSSFNHMELFEESGTYRYKGPFTSDELALDSLSAARNPSGREGLVNAIHDLNQPLFLGKLIELLTNETDLMIADRETLAISDITKEDFHPRDLGRVESWWETHCNQYTNWPYAEFQEGLNQFTQAHYSDAINSFNKVFISDPSADMSRAITIGCYWETGETNKAVNLAKGFKNSTGRWEQWATAKAELETGNVSNATIQLANLYTNYPTMTDRGFIDRWRFWRKVDWQLFNQNAGQTK